MEELIKKLEIIHNIVKAEITAPCLCPITAKHALPPSSRKMGNKLSAEDIIPNRPITKRGCIGIGWASGSIMVLGRSHERIDPSKKFDFIACTDKKGNRAICTADALLVSATPPKTIHRDTARDAIGPLSAKSTRAARFGGKDRRGVMHPKKGRFE
mmetsp:Transcript_1838/g.4289  ORF Transcript_1838/g.4289 Transcript_1838/m.4289 type:complete len:156 (+) Transcript_1838:1205-1672(+)